MSEEKEVPGLEEKWIPITVIYGDQPKELKFNIKQPVQVVIVRSVSYTHLTLPTNREV